MKTPKDLAIDAVHEAMMSGWGRATFMQMLQDQGDAGTQLRKLVTAVERAIENDRKAHAAQRAPS